MLSWIINVLESLGYMGIFVLMVLEHLFPPIPSELIMPLSGFISHRSTDMNLPLVILAGSLGSVVGTLAWYALGRLVSQDQILLWVERYGGWVALKPKDIHNALKFFQDGRGQWAVGIGRVVPGIRTYVSVPAGLSDMPLVSYLIYSAAGTVVWTGALAIAGYVLGNRFDQVQMLIAPVSKIVLISLGIILMYWFVKRLYHSYDNQS